METLMHMHGGDLDAIEREYGIPKNEISDFSGNINPLGFPKKAAVGKYRPVAALAVPIQTDYAG